MVPSKIMETRDHYAKINMKRVRKFNRVLKYMVELFFYKVKMAN